jgi:hypothetical protein
VWRAAWALWFTFHVGLLPPAGTSATPVFGSSNMSASCRSVLEFCFSELPSRQFRSTARSVAFLRLRRANAAVIALVSSVRVDLCASYHESAILSVVSL